MDDFLRKKTNSLKSLPQKILLTLFWENNPKVPQNNTAPEKVPLLEVAVWKTNLIENCATEIIHVLHKIGPIENFLWNDDARRKIRLHNNWDLLSEKNNKKQQTAKNIYWVLHFLFLFNYFLSCNLFVRVVVVSFHSVSISHSVRKNIE